MPTGQYTRVPRGPYRKKPVEERFWSYVHKTDTCWLWTGAVQNAGYGVLHIRASDGPRTILAHRFSWELHNGPIPDGAHVLHRCDNRPCVWPEHLWLGNQAANMADMAAKGRNRRNGVHVAAMFTAEQAEAIRAVYAAGGVSRRALARLYGCSHSTIDGIVNGRRYLPS